MSDKTHYIYIGRFFHRTDDEKSEMLNLWEKKIGITSDLKGREYNLGNTKSPLGYTILKAWKVGDKKSVMQIENKIKAILSHDISYGEWYKDENDEQKLISRLSNFMQDYDEAPLPSDEDDKDVSNVRQQAQQDIALDEIREKYIRHLIDMPFHLKYKGLELTVIMKDEGKYYCEETEATCDTMNDAFASAGDHFLGYRIPLNAWKGPKNVDGNTRDEALQKIAKSMEHNDTQ